MSPQTYVPALTLEPVKRVVPEEHSPRAISVPRFIDDVVGGRVELPTIPRVVQQLIAALRDPDVSSRTICRVLSQDPVLSAKVLRVANSSHLGCGRSMASIESAVAMIGTQALARLATACGVSSSFKSIAAIDLRVFWRDALVAATAACRLAPLLNANPEEAYVCGLLHAAGHLILCQSYPDIANAMFAGFEIMRGAELAAIERDCFGIDHPAAGELWVRTMGFPASVASTIGSAASPACSADTPLDIALRGACGLTAAVALKTGEAAACEALPKPLRAAFATGAGTPSDAFTDLYSELANTEPMT
jgi:HD-like signal output (HDOD) protein